MGRDCLSIKEAFTSRWQGGFIVDVDFSQLEVVALAILSQDSCLKDDILSGRDMHTLRAADLFGIKPEHVTKDKRQLAKQLSFQLQYGAGAKSMAEKNGISKALAERFIFQYYDRYQEVKHWQDDVAAEVKGSRTPSERRTSKGYPSGTGTHQSPTGRFYRFYEYDNPFREGETSFSPTEMKNYPVQGFAADIMAVYRARLYRRLLADTPEVQEHVKLINTVHDSVMFDVAYRGMVDYVYEVAKDTSDSLPGELWKLWKIECPVGFNVECKYGPTWGEMEKLT